MDTTWIHDFAKALPGTESDYKAEWEAHRFMLAGKMYAMQGGYKDGRPLLSLKLNPERGDFMRRQYPQDIIPGYYLNKTHWNSIFLDTGTVPQDEIKTLLAEAHGVVLNSLPKKTQAAIKGE